MNHSEAQSADRLLMEYRAILDHAGLAILFTRDQAIYRCNRRAAEVFGWDSEAALTGQSGRVLFSTKSAFDAFNRTARPLLGRGEILDIETGLAHRDGTHIDGHVIARAIDPVNPRAGTIWLIEDITAKRALIDSNERLLREHQIIFDYALTGIMFTRDRKIVRCNRRFEEIFGYSMAQVVGASTRILFGNDERWEEVGHRVYQGMADHQRFQGEIEYRRANGTPLWARVLGNVVDPENPESGFVWIIEDASARKKAEDALLESHRQLETRVEQRTAEIKSQLHFLQQLIEAIPGPVFYKDTTGRYLGCNSAFAEVMGVEPEALVGKTAYDIAPPELAKQFTDSDLELLASPGAKIYESRLRHADGTLRDAVFHKATFTRPDGSVNGVVGVMIDITERKRLEERIQLAATVFNSTADGVTIADREGRIVTVNRAFTEITGYSEDEVRGKNPRFLQSGLQDDAFYAGMWSRINKEGRWTGDIWNRRKNGSIFPEALTITAVKDDSGQIAHYVGVFSDITRLKSAQEALDFQAHHDPLTGLPNRLLLDDRLDSALQRAKRERSSLALLFIDLDRFKVINDTLGHHVGDAVLCEAALRFSASVRESDTVARLGGDEFIIILENIPEPSAASRVADKILDELRRPIRIASQEFFIGASIGISLYPQDGEQPADLLKHADAAMYRAKERGRNTFEFFSSEITAHSLERFRLEADIRYALERDELRVWFQPQFSLKDGRLVGAEALVRWQHPERGMVSPGQFIPIAEESGMIVPMGEWILRRACRDWEAWHRQGLNPGVLAVNVSGIEFRRGRVRESVELTLAETRLPPDMLELEITESSIMNQADHSIQALHALREMGLQLAIDDFGTGYSSLAYLKRLPLSKLKVDQSFVVGLPENAEDVAITRVIIALAKSLGLTTMAEGVETEAQRAFLVAEGCDEMQGYLAAHPMPAEAFGELLAHRKNSAPGSPGP